MKKEEAIDKVLKLRRLAERAGTPAEAEAANNAANKISAEHSISSSDLSNTAKCAAFDDLIGRLNKIVDNQPDGVIPHGLIGLALSQTKNKASPEEKVSGLNTLVGFTRTAGLFSRSPFINSLKKTVEETLLKHKITI